MLARTIKICILAILFSIAGTACKSTKSKLSQENAAQSHYVVDRQFSDSNEVGK